MTTHLFLSTMTSRPCTSSKEHVFVFKKKQQPVKHFSRLFTCFSYVLRSQSRVCVRLCAMLLRQLEPVRYRIGMHVCILIFETYHTCLPIAFVQECKVSDVLNPIVHVVPFESALFVFQITHVYKLCASLIKTNSWPMLPNVHALSKRTACHTLLVDDDDSQVFKQKPKPVTHV